MMPLTAAAVEGVEEETIVKRVGQESVRVGRTVVVHPPTDVTNKWIEEKFAPAAPLADLAAFDAGWLVGEPSELLDVPVQGQARDRSPAAEVSECQRHNRAVFGVDGRERQKRAPAAIWRVIR